MGLNYKNKRFLTKGQLKAERNKENPGRAPKTRTGRLYVNGETVESSNMNRLKVREGLQKVGNVCQEMDENYSLIDAQTDNEVIDNPNIPFVIGKDKSAQDKKIKATDKFPNASDPFYDADSNVPVQESSPQQAITKQITNMKSLKPAMDLIDLNQIADSGLKLKQMSVMPSQS